MEFEIRSRIMDETEGFSAWANQPDHLHPFLKPLVLAFFQIVSCLYRLLKAIRCSMPM